MTKINTDDFAHGRTRNGITFECDDGVGGAGVADDFWISSAIAFSFASAAEYFLQSRLRKAC
jgi:hypothetical protein